MAHDELLAMRFRDAQPRRKGYSEKRMMGGLCFMLNNHMVGGADRTRDGQGRFMFRVGKDNHAKALKRKGAQPMIMGGKTMSGFLFVDEKDCHAKALRQWIDLAIDFVDTLPPK
jgi:hypothetical protein